MSPPAARTSKQRAGDAAEAAAAAHLMAAGCRILARNARYRDGEVDLIVRERDLLVFVEVRMRASARFGGAAVSVNSLKQKRIVRAAQHWLLRRYGERWPACRFDVVTVDGSGTIEWIRDAFQCT
ncbi:MAG TPA: YraN family protein [Burkholderiaceae bacterium]|nr:YraN family protein [Burkholderiaceae bacterium]